MSVMVKNKTNKNYKRSQKGRSMVEMLGVLAIIGVLSVGGVYGYGVAMKKHKANELLHQASMLATTISAQIMSGKEPTALDTFADSNLGKFALDYDPTKTTFDLKISEMDGSVCSQLKEGGMVQKVECNETAKTASITYYKNLATNDEEGAKSPTGGEACDLKAKDCVSGALAEGECACAPATEGQTCTDHTTNECGLGYYCQFSPNDCGDTKGGNPNGVCTAVGSGTSIKGGAYLRGPDPMDWWSAYSWCKGNEMNLVTGTIAGIPLNSDYFSEDSGDFGEIDNGVLYPYFGEEIYFWTEYDYGDSCNAWNVGANPEGEGVSPSGRDAPAYYALCQE